MMICVNLRHRTVAANRHPLAGLVEVAETEIACRSKHGPLTGGGGRGHQGKIIDVGASRCRTAGLVQAAFGGSVRNSV